MINCAFIFQFWESFLNFHLVQNENFKSFYRLAVLHCHVRLLTLLVKPHFVQKADISASYFKISKSPVDLDLRESLHRYWEIISGFTEHPASIKIDR